MELKLNIHDKQVTYELSSQKGEGLEGLVRSLTSDITKVLIEGETESYSFMRQIALLVNILKKTQDIEIALDSSSFQVINNLLVPIYKN